MRTTAASVPNLQMPPPPTHLCPSVASIPAHSQGLGSADLFFFVHIAVPAFDFSSRPTCDSNPETGEVEPQCPLKSSQWGDPGVRYGHRVEDGGNHRC